MLEIVNKVLNQVFGNKSDKDIKELRPLVEIINGHFASYSSLSNDQLRGKTIEFKKRIQDSIKEDQDKVNELKAIIEKNGGKNTGSVSAKTSFLLAGEGMGPSKRAKAEKLEVQIISEADFEDLIA